ncbi:MAG TPA: MarR family winged helix-turn-helix transcriptional regulator [Pseudonocardia sp.]|jgi:DNA-binding MarR family transcriptional regulator|nr:MarR family winged helix-turn-helix transcriptional regulator [Pseudonocardia sp.]
MDDDAVSLFRLQVKALQRRLRQEVPPLRGLSRSALQVLAAVSRKPGTSPREVAAELQMTSSNVAAALREGEGGGFLERRRDPDDARRARLSLTVAGAEAVARMRNERDTWLGRAVDAVLTADEQRTLVEAGRLMERLAHFEPAAMAASPGSVAAAGSTVSAGSVAAPGSGVS